MMSSSETPGLSMRSLHSTHSVCPIRVLHVRCPIQSFNELSNHSVINVLSQGSDMTSAHVTLILMSSLIVSGEHRRKVIGCEGNTIGLLCEPDKVVSVVRANYGRISQNICIDRSDKYLDNWSTRCIQPTTLRQVTSSCDDQVSTCSIHVSSQVFGDPCPGTPKYLEVVYTCNSPADVLDTPPSLPDWILKIKSFPEALTSTTTEVTTSTESSTKDSTVPTFSRKKSLKNERKMMRIMKDNLMNTEYPESLPLMNEEKLDKSLEKIIINKPKTPKVEENIFEDERILPAIIVTAVSVFILCVIAVYMLLHKKDSDSASEAYTIVKLDNCQYQNFIANASQNDSKVYRLPPRQYISCHSLDQQSENYYQII